MLDRLQAAAFSVAETGTGNLNFTNSAETGSIDGTCTVGWIVTDNASGSAFNFAYTAQVIFKALDYDASCDTTYFTSGSLDISVTVASTDSEFTGVFENFGIQIDWNGCGNPGDRRHGLSVELNRLAATANPGWRLLKAFHQHERAVPRRARLVLSAVAFSKAVFYCTRNAYTVPLAGT